MIEYLEERRLLAASLVNGILNVPGTTRSDVVFTRLVGKSIVVSLNSVESRFLLAKVRSIFINGGNGNDFITNCVGSIPARLAGGNGDDILSGGMASDTLQGGPGNDRLYGQAGDDLLDGGAGDDIIAGGMGKDTVTYAGRPKPVTVDLSQGAGGGPGEHDSISGVENITGGNGNDSLAGDKDANILTGGPGNDTFTGNDGQDTFFGEAGDDTFMDVDDTSDTIDGGNGNDTAYTDGELDSVDNVENMPGGQAG